MVSGVENGGKEGHMTETARTWLLLLLSFLSGYAGAWGASCFGFVDLPTARSSHRAPIPKGGGVGILGAFLFAGWIYNITPFIILPATTVSLVSLADDRRDISPAIRLVVQFLAALVTVAAFSWNWWYVILASVFVVGTANFYNFMDGINGLAGITGVVGFSLLGWYGQEAGHPHAYSMLCFAVAVSCCGFLPMNLPLAHVFMGDVGSVLLGFVYAVIVLKFSNNSVEFLLLISFLFLFYADVLVCLLERLGQGEALTRAHRSHLYQFLANECGYAHWQVTLAYMLAQICVALCAWRAAQYGVVFLSAWLVFCMSVFILLNHQVKHRVQL